MAEKMSEALLTDWIELYAELKAEADKKKKDAEKLNLAIKDGLLELGLDEYEGKCYTVSRSVINKDVLDEDTLLQTLHEILPEEFQKQVIKTKEYIDLDKLEDLVYNRVIKADTVNACIVHKQPTIRLNIKKNKEEKDAEE